MLRLVLTTRALATARSSTIPSSTSSSFYSSSPLSPLLTLQCHSHTSSFKQDGYYRLTPKEIEIPPHTYETTACRGSGPGGQGTNSSSNKIELRVSLELLAQTLDPELMVAFRQRNPCGDGIVSSDGSTMLVSSHEHRSALKNKEACLWRVRELLAEASWVPPVEAEKISTPSSTIHRHKQERRKKGNFLKMRSAARRGLW